MYHRAFIVRFQPGGREEWLHRHQAVWPELLDEERSAGFVFVGAYGFDDDQILVTSVFRNEDSWERLRATDVHRRWAEWMAPLTLAAAERSDLEALVAFELELPRPPS